MKTEDSEFFSEGYRLRATVYYPDDIEPDEQLPALIINSGYQGFNAFYPRMFAEKLTEMGFVCLGFDYRGMAQSEGQRGRVLIEEQVQDTRNAVTFVQSRDHVDRDRIGLIGWGMGAACVVLAADKLWSLSAVAALNGFYDGVRWLKSVHSFERWTEILEEIQADRENRVLTGESELADTFAYYPLDSQTGEYVEAELSVVEGFGEQIQLQFTESIIDLKAEHVVPNLAPKALFVAHGFDNRLHPYTEAQALYNAASAPKTLYRINGRHNDFMYGAHPEFRALCQRLGEFFAEMLRKPTRSGIIDSERLPN